MPRNKYFRHFKYYAMHAVQGRTQGGVQGTPLFQINYIHSMAWQQVEHANSYCFPGYLFKDQIVIKIPTKYTQTEINIDTVCKLYLQKYPRRIECASLLFQ